MSAGKGDKPRNNFSKRFRDNYDGIKWGVKNMTNKDLYVGALVIPKSGIQRVLEVMKLLSNNRVEVEELKSRAKSERYSSDLRFAKPGEVEAE